MDGMVSFQFSEIAWMLSEHTLTFFDLYILFPAFTKRGKIPRSKLFCALKTRNIIAWDDIYILNKRVKNVIYQLRLA